MNNLLLYAIPLFVGCVLAEAALFRFFPDEELAGCAWADSATSLAMGLGYLVLAGGWKLVLLAAYAGLYAVTPLRLGQHGALSWAVLLLADDAAFYAYHRAHHEVRMLWASHVVHHSSQRYNLTTALRQPWIVVTALPFWLPLALLGFTPLQILTQQSVSLLYQFFLHTERVGRLPKPIEWVFNTPSHHRVHHGSNQRYLDRNYGGILIIWDRLLGTFEPEGERVRYGLTTNITSYAPWRVASHEVLALAADVRAATGWRTRAAHLLRGPGWQPATMTG